METMDPNDVSIPLMVEAKLSTEDFTPPNELEKPEEVDLKLIAAVEIESKAA